MNTVSTNRESFWDFTKENTKEAVRLYFDPIRQCVRWMQRQILPHYVAAEFDRLKQQQAELERLMKEVDLLRHINNAEIRFRNDRESEHSGPEGVVWHLDTEAFLQSQFLDESAIQKYAAVLTDDQRRLLLTLVRDTKKIIETDVKITLSVRDIKDWDWRNYSTRSGLRHTDSSSSINALNKKLIESERMAETIDSLLRTVILLLTVERSRFDTYVDPKSHQSSSQRNG